MYIITKTRYIKIDVLNIISDLCIKINYKYIINYFNN